MATAVTSIGAAGMGSMGLAHAATSTTNGTNPQQSIVDKLTSKFNLKKDDVQKVFDEEHTTREAERTAKTKDKLDALVKDGKITQAQEDKLIAKADEMRANHETNREAMKDKTMDERKAAMQTERDAYKKWLSDNSIAEEYGRMIMGGHGHGGPGGPGGHGGPRDSGESTAEN